MPVPGHALHVQRLDLQNTGLGCQPVTQLVQQIFPPLADFAMDRAHAALERVCAPILIWRRESARCARRSRFCAFRRCLGASTSSNAAPSKAVTSVLTPRSTPTVISLG